MTQAVIGVAQLDLEHSRTSILISIQIKMNINVEHKVKGGRRFYIKMLICGICYFFFGQRAVHRE